MVYFLQHTLFLLFFTIHYISYKSTLPFIPSEIQNDTLEEEKKEKLPFRLPLTFLLETLLLSQSSKMGWVRFEGLDP